MGALSAVIGEITTALSRGWHARVHGWNAAGIDVVHLGDFAPGT